jgi:hypothetical protein
MSRVQPIRFCEYCENQTLPRCRQRFCSDECQWAAYEDSLDDRFWHRLGNKMPSGCILWGGAFNEDGHGEIGVRRHYHQGAHVVAYRLMVGSVPKGMCVCHRCDNPPCINPVHLFLGTSTDNRMDCVAKGRQAKGERNAKSKLNAERVKAMRARYASAPMTFIQLAKEFNISPAQANKIINGEFWKHIA